MKLTPASTQTAAALESFKMESPVKKLNFNAANKENQPLTDVATATDITTIQAKPVEEPAKPQEKPTVAPGIKEHEIDEPLLQENGQRFVLFPIKYHEVCHASLTRKVAFSGKPC